MKIKNEVGSTLKFFGRALLLAVFQTVLWVCVLSLFPTYPESEWVMAIAMLVGVRLAVVGLTTYCLRRFYKYIKARIEDLGLSSAERKQKSDSGFHPVLGALLSVAFFLGIISLSYGSSVLITSTVLFVLGKTPLPSAMVEISAVMSTTGLLGTSTPFLLALCMLWYLERVMMQIKALESHIDTSSEVRATSKIRECGGSDMSGEVSVEPKVIERKVSPSKMHVFASDYFSYSTPPPRNFSAWGSALLMAFLVRLGRLGLAR